MRRLPIRRIGLFPRLALLVALGFALLFTVMGIMGQQALDASTRRILEERLVLTEMAAEQIDAHVQQAFHELLRASTFARFDPNAKDLSEEYHLLAHTYARIGAITLGVYFLDTRGNVVLAEPGEAASSEVALQAIRQSFAGLGTGRVVSQPFLEPRTKRPAVAVTLGVANGNGEAMSYISGLVDLSAPEITGPMEQALKLGRTGHSELVTAEGNVIVSTYPSPFLDPGEHQGFYRAVLATPESSTIKTVPYEVDGRPTAPNHIMAVVPLSTAGWGLALGGEEGETLAPVLALRRNLLLAGLVMLAATLAVTLWGTRHLIRPVQALTERARAMADGDLSTPVAISTNGEIGLLGEAINDLRSRVLDARDRLTQWNLELEDRVRRRSQEVAELRAQVELERLKAEFVSEVSHEFRTPLGLIKGYVTTLQRGDISPDDATRSEFLSVIREEADKLEALVEDLLDTSRIRAGTFAINREKVDLEDLVQRVLARAQPRASQHRIVRLGTTALPHIQADARRLEQVFDNLFDNALKYSSGGDITVSAGTEDGSVHFCVSDQGEGIPAEELERVFNAFYRGSRQASKGPKGSGLGLTICRGIVQAHGGRMWAQSAPGKGTAFHFTIPVDGESHG